MPRPRSTPRRRCTTSAVARAISRLGRRARSLSVLMARGWSELSPIRVEFRIDSQAISRRGAGLEWSMSASRSGTSNS